MKEFFALLLHAQIKDLLFKPTSNLVIQAFRGAFVGVIAFVADAAVLWLLTLLGIHYLISAVLSFVVGVLVNYVLSVRFVFKEKAAIGRTGELVAYFVISLIGLGITVALMWIFTERLGLYYMVSKCLAALIAFVWNFTARKIALYRE